jgi:prepilin-type N-terminal cleavage/methylation domain-containing protein
MKSGKRVNGFTLVEIMIVVSVIGILTGIAVPGFVKAREKAQSTACMESQSKMDGAVDIYAIDTGKKTGDVVTDPSVLIGKLQYVKTWPRCPVEAGSNGPAHIAIPAVGSSSFCRRRRTGANKVA